MYWKFNFINKLFNNDAISFLSEFNLFHHMTLLPHCLNIINADWFCRPVNESAVMQQCPTVWKRSFVLFPSFVLKLVSGDKECFSVARDAQLKWHNKLEWKVFTNVLVNGFPLGCDDANWAWTDTDKNIFSNNRWVLFHFSRCWANSPACLNCKWSNVTY